MSLLTLPPSLWRVGHRENPLGFTPHELAHLDLNEITSRRRAVTQTIAGDLYDQGAAAIRFPSRLDGNPCLAVFEGRATVDQVGAAVALTDPAPEALVNVCAAWRLLMEPVGAVHNPATQ